MRLMAYDLIPFRIFEVYIIVDHDSLKLSRENFKLSTNISHTAP
jgi:hypothetical protein